MRFNLQRLRFERLSRKVSQEEMAQALNINRSSYYKKENGDIKISVEEFAVILEVLDFPQKEAGYFFGHNVPDWEQNREHAVVVRENAFDDSCVTTA